MNEDLQRQLELKRELADWAHRDNLTDADNKVVQGLLDEYDAVTRSIKLDELRTAHNNPSTRTENCDDDANAAKKSFQVGRRNVGDPWTNESASVRDRAFVAVERMRLPDIADDGAVRHKATQILESPNVNELGQRFIVESSREDYVSAFKKMLVGREMSMSDAERAAVGRVDTVSRAMGEGSIGAGQALVPVVLDPTLILTNVGTINPFRQISRLETILTQSWLGVSTAGVSAEWGSEAAEMTDASPTLTQPKITPVRGDALVQYSWELAMDTSLESEISVALADAKDRLESTAFAVGTGSTQPKGVITAVSGVTASRVAGTSGAAGAADFVLADVYATYNALNARALTAPRTAWVAHPTIANKIRRFGEGVTANAAFWTDLGRGTPSSLLGIPFHLSSEMDSTIVSGSNDDVLLIGNFQQYLIADRLPGGVVVNPMVLGPNRRPTGERQLVYWFRTGADVIDTDAFRLLRL